MLRVLQAFRWLNRHAASSVLLFLLVGTVAFLDFLAWFRMEMVQRKFMLMNPQTIHGMRAIDLIHDEFWMVIVYVAVFWAGLLWLEIRNAPRWTVWLTFAFLAMPCLTYASICAYIGNKMIIW